eukprot:6973656-Prymnesium_polylepis.2
MPSLTLYASAFIVVLGAVAVLELAKVHICWKLFAAMLSCSVRSSVLGAGWPEGTQVGPMVQMQVLTTLNGGPMPSGSDAMTTRSFRAAPDGRSGQQAAVSPAARPRRVSALRRKKSNNPTTRRTRRPWNEEEEEEGDVVGSRKCAVQSMLPRVTT